MKRRWGASLSALVVVVVGGTPAATTAAVGTPATTPPAATATAPTPTATAPPAATPPAATPRATAPAAAARDEALAWIDHLAGLYRHSDQCTAWAVRRRRDIFIALNLPAVTRWVESGRTTRVPRRYVRDAWTWALFAADNPDVTVTRRPTPRAVMVVARGGRIPTARGTRVAGAVTGHVAYVEGVRTDGSAVVSEMNDLAGPGRVDRFVLPARGLPSRDIVFLQLSPAAAHALRTP